MPANGGVNVPLKSVAGNRYLLFVVRDGTLKEMYGIGRGEGTGGQACPRRNRRWRSAMSCLSRKLGRRRKLGDAVAGEKPKERKGLTLYNEALWTPIWTVAK